ncbi:hypothetical protein CASFOL_034103 [Castilleja foliolosa]|uniref:Uncharacterized protein n=1 Tax=Castilleja foliolosa TaxID=1961234 RepID=A0ABD3BXB4_9LAMI
MAYQAMKQTKPGLEETQEAVHRIPISFSSKNVKNSRKIYEFQITSSSGGGTGGIVTKDALGNDVVAEEWLKNHLPDDRTLTEGLKGYLKADLESADFLDLCLYRSHRKPIWIGQNYPSRLPVSALVYI